MEFKGICDYAKKRGWKLGRISGDHLIFVKQGKRPVPIQRNKHEIEGVYLKRILKQFDQ